MTDSLFSEEDLDQEKLEEEAKLREPVIIEKKVDPVKIDAVRECVMCDEKKRFFVIDGYGLIYRSYFAFITRPLYDADKNNVSAIFGFFNTLFLVLREYHPDYLVVAMDSHGPTFRHEMYPEYKANRDAAPEDLHAQVPRICEILDAMHIKTIGKVGLEADDIIASLARECEREMVEYIMVTADKDLLQLVDSNTKALRPPKKGETKYRLFGSDEVLEAYGVRPDQIVDYLSLLGDASDNVPGVKGIGEKGAVKLLAEYGSLDGIYERAFTLSKSMQKKILDGKDDAYLSQTLVKLRNDYFDTNEFVLEDYLCEDIDYASTIPYFEHIKAKGLVDSAKRMMNPEDRQAIRRVENTPDEPEESSAHAAPEELLGAGRFETVTTMERLEELLDRCPGIMAFDVETTDIDEMKARLVGFSFSYENKVSYYVPVLCQGKLYFDEEKLREVLNRYLSTGRISVVGQNIKYDWKVMLRYGVTIRNIEFDTMIAAWLQDPNSGVYNLDHLASYYLNHETIRYEDVVPKGKTFDCVALDKATDYGAEDSDITWRLYQLFRNMLSEGHMKLLKEMEIPLIPVLARMELDGIMVSRDRMQALNDRFTSRIKELENSIYAIAGHEFNINSTQQLGKVLFEERGLAAGKKTRTGYSTAVNVLESLKGSDPIIDCILEYKGLNKLNSTYVEPLPQLINPETGRIHPQFVQVGTATGRLSCRNPNLQNIPIRSEDGRAIRDAFVPKEGYVFLSADYAQIELVVLAHVSGDEALQKAFRDGVDVHRYTASMIFQCPFEDVTPDQRRVAKTINFGVMYGMSAFRLSNELQIPRKEASDFITSYFTRYNGISSFIDRTVKEAEKNGYVTTMSGHTREVEHINSRNHNEKSGAQRVAVNTVIQGTAAEIMKIGMLNVMKRLENSDIDARLLLQVHDELIFEVRESDAERLRDVVKSELEGAVKLSVPLRSSIETGRSWGEMH